jgi:hypothetical protein
MNNVINKIDKNIKTYLLELIYDCETNSKKYKMKNVIKDIEIKEVKIIKEDFSYYEEISNEQLKKTEIFILDSLSNLYSLQGQENKAIDLLNIILSYDIDTQTVVLTKYKLAKLKCIIKENDDALDIVKEFISNQHFEPVALAVANAEFQEINSKILEILQFKLEEINISLKSVAMSKIDKLNLIEIDNDFKSLIILSIEKCSTEIEKSVNYSILLSSEFKESYNEFLQYLDLLCELKLKTEHIERLLDYANLSEEDQKALLRKI